MIGDTVWMVFRHTLQQLGDITFKIELWTAKMSKHNLCKYSFAERIVDLCNCLLACIISGSSGDSFKRNLDKFWCNHDVCYNCKATVNGNGNRSIVMW